MAIDNMVVTGIKMELVKDQFVKDIDYTSRYYNKKMDEMEQKTRQVADNIARNLGKITTGLRSINQNTTTSTSAINRNLRLVGTQSLTTATQVGKMNTALNQTHQAMSGHASGFYSYYNQWNQLGMAIDQVANSLLRIGTIGLVGADRLANKYGDFAKSTMQTYMLEPNMDYAGYKMMENRILGLARKEGINATSLGKMTYDMSSVVGGYDNARPFLGQTARFSKGAFISPELAGSINASGMVNFNIRTPEELAMYNDMFMGSVRASKAEANELAPYINNIAPIYRMAGIGYEDMMIHNAALTKTLKPSKAATVQSQYLRDLVKKEGGVNEIVDFINENYKGVHYDYINSKSIQERGIDDVDKQVYEMFKILQEKTPTTIGTSKNGNKISKDRIMSKFYSHANTLQYLNALYSDEGMFAMNEARNTVRNSKGLVEQGAKKYEESEYGKYEMAKARVDASLIKIGMALMPAMASLLEQVDRMLQPLREMDEKELNALMKGIVETLKWFIMIGIPLKMLSSVLLSIGGLVWVLPIFKNAITGLTGSTGALANGFNWLFGSTKTASNGLIALGPTATWTSKNVAVAGNGLKTTFMTVGGVALRLATQLGLVVAGAYYFQKALWAIIDKFDTGDTIRQGKDNAWNWYFGNSQMDNKYLEAGLRGGVGATPLGNPFIKGWLQNRYHDDINIDAENTPEGKQALAMGFKKYWQRDSSGRVSSVMRDPKSAQYAISKGLLFESEEDARANYASGKDSDLSGLGDYPMPYDDTNWDDMFNNIEDAVYNGANNGTNAGAEKGAEKGVKQGMSGQYGQPSRLNFPTYANVQQIMNDYEKLKYNPARSGNGGSVQIGKIEVKFDITGAKDSKTQQEEIKNVVLKTINDAVNNQYRNASTYTPTAR